MENEQMNLTLVPNIDKGTGMVTLGNFDALKETCSKFIKDNSIFVHPTIQDPAEIKICKNERTELNKAKKSISDARIKINSFLMGDFNEKCKELEKMLDTASKEHTESLNNAKEILEGKTEQQAGAPQVYTIQVSSLDLEVIEKVKEYAKKKGCIVI